MKIGYTNGGLQRIPIKRPLDGYYVRWYYNGYHYWQFLPGSMTLKTEGENYRTLSSRAIVMASGQVTREQISAIRTIFNTREVSFLTPDGWISIRVEPGSVVVSENQVSGYEISFVAIIGSREGYFSPVVVVPSTPNNNEEDLYDPTKIVIVHHNDDGTFTIVVVGDGEITIDWGDGTTTTVVLVPGELVTITHTYPSPLEDSYVVTIDGEENITHLIIEDQHVTQVLLPPTIVNLQELDLSGNELTELIIPPEAISLTTLDLSDNLFTEPPYIPPTVPIVFLNMDGNPLSDEWCTGIIGSQIWDCHNYAGNYPNSKSYENDDEGTVDLYGRLYSHSQVHAVNFPPNGKHLPTKQEWEQLIDFVGGLAVAGGRLKAIGTTYWKTPNTDASDEVDFDARGGGYYFEKQWLYEVYGGSNIFGSIAGPDVAMIPANVTYGSAVWTVNNGDAFVKAGLFIAPVDGTYAFQCMCIPTSGAPVLKLYKNGVNQGNMTHTYAGMMNITSYFNMSLVLTAGDTVTFVTNPYSFNYWELRIMSISAATDRRWQALTEQGTYWMRRIAETGVDSLKKYYAKMAYNSAALTIQYHDCVDERIGEDDEWRSVRLISNFKPKPCETIIGSQIWSCKNIDAIIPYVDTKYYNDDPANLVTYGRLYTWRYATWVAALFPGWRLPTRADFQQLIDYLGGDDVAGGKLKEAGTTHWNAPNTDADNSSGFTALGGGLDSRDFRYVQLKEGGYFWTSEIKDSASAYCMYVRYNTAEAHVDTLLRFDKASVRLIRNFAIPPPAAIITTTKVGSFDLYLDSDLYEGVITIDWGDGTTQTHDFYDGGLSASHIYASGGTIRITGALNKITTISASSMNVTTADIRLLTNIKYVYFSQNQLTAFPTSELWTALITLNFIDNDLTALTTYATWVNFYELFLGNNALTSLETHSTWVLMHDFDVRNNQLTSLVCHPEWTLLHYLVASDNLLTTFTAHPEWTHLDQFVFNGNQLTSIDTFASWDLNVLFLHDNAGLTTIATFATWVRLTYVHCQNCALTSFEVFREWTTLSRLKLEGNAIASSTDINNMLIEMDAGVAYCPILVVNFLGGTMGSASGAGLTAKASLISKGANVSTY